MANILLACIIIIFSLLGTRHIRISLPLTITLLSIALIIPRELYSRLFFEASDLFSQDSFIHSKLNDLALYFHLGGYGGTGAGHRAARYPLLLEAFFKAPFLGYFSNEGMLDIAPGAHIFWMYKLTVFGVLAFVGFLTVFYVYIKNSLKMFDQEFTFYFFLSVFSVIGLGLIKNLAGRELWYMLFFLIPGLYHLSLLQRNHKKTITYSQTLPLYNIDRP